MQILLTSAKTMNDVRDVKTKALSVPYFLNDANKFALDMSGRTVEELQDMFACNAQIAIQNLLRYQQFFDEELTRPAIFLYNGQAYKGLQPRDFTSDDLTFAQKHLWISSFLYGLLRPMDGIHPYRMEGNVHLPSADDKSLFSYWKPRLTDLLIQSVMEDDGVLVHVATEEIQHLFDWQRVLRSVRVIQPKFLVEKHGRLRIITVYSKACRGNMAHYIIKNRIQNPSSLRDFSYEGFTYNDHLSDTDNLSFILE